MFKGIFWSENFGLFVFFFFFFNFWPCHRAFGLLLPWIKLAHLCIEREESLNTTGPPGKSLKQVLRRVCKMGPKAWGDLSNILDVGFVAKYEWHRDTLEVNDHNLTFCYWKNKRFYTKSSNRRYLSFKIALLSFCGVIDSFLSFWNT